MKKGFTLIEMMLTLTVMIILAGISAPLYMSFQARNDMEVASSILVSSLRRAQSMAQNMEQDANWGVRLETQELVIFKGSSYAARDSQYDEVYSISPVVHFSGLSEVVFKKMSGETDNTGDITISANNNEKKVTINKKGMLEF